MKVCLLDVNTLVALLWTNHEQHEAACAWFLAHQRGGWATCPLTQTGFIRVSSNPRVFPDAPSPGKAAEILAANLGHANHHFWKDEIPFTRAVAPFGARLSGHQQVTDAYLLGVAIHKHGVLATFDAGVCVPLDPKSRVIVLENRCVKLRYAGTDECVPPEVASEIRRIRKRQTLSFDVMVGIPGIRQRLTARPDHTIRRLVGFIQLHSQWVAAQQRRKRLAGRSSVNSSQLPASKCPLREPRAHFGSGQFPGKVGSKNLAYVEVRQTASRTLVEEERIEQPVGKGVVRHRRRKRVDALSPRVCATNLDTVAHSLRDDHLQGVIERVGLPKHAGHAAEVWIEFLTARCRREEITGRCERRQDHVEIIDPERLVDAPRSHITERENNAGRKFM